jgi:hypothetical protein
MFFDMAGLSQVSELSPSRSGVALRNVFVEATECNPVARVKESSVERFKNMPYIQCIIMNYTDQNN